MPCRQRDLGDARQREVCQRQQETYSHQAAHKSCQRMLRVVILEAGQSVLEGLLHKSGHQAALVVSR